MKNPLFSLLAFLLLLQFSCDSTPSSTAILEDIPELLDRPEKIRHGVEWDRTRNQYTEAKAALFQDKTALENYLKIAEVFITEARITGEHGHYYPGALKVLDKILEAEELSSDLRFQGLSMKASVQLSQHEFSEALASAKEAIQLNNFNAQIHGVLTDALVELGQYEEAVIAADRMVAIRPDLRSYARVSYLREIYGDPEGALRAMHRAVDAGFPGYEQTAWTRLTLGDLYNTYGSPEKARQQYEITLQERENYPFAIAALAQIEMDQGNFAKAETYLNEAKAIIPEVGFYIQLADLYQQTDREAEAKSLIDEVFLMLEDDVNSGHNMNLEYADLYLNLLDAPDRALHFANQEFKKRPDNIDVNRMLAAAYLKQKNPKKAQLHLAKASTTNSKHPDLIEIKNQLNKHLLSANLN